MQCIVRYYYGMIIICYCICGCYHSNVNVFHLLYICQIWNFKKTPPLIDERTLDEDVAAEAQYARQVYSSHRSKQALLATGLSKYYGKSLAVDQISFSKFYRCGTGIKANLHPKITKVL